MSSGGFETEYSRCRATRPCDYYQTVAWSHSNRDRHASSVPCYVALPGITGRLRATLPAMNPTQSRNTPDASPNTDPSDSHEKPKVIVVGLDGAGFDLLTPWLEAGELPALERIIDSGVSGSLQSVLPPVTSPNWKAYATGKNPGKLGIFWWKNIDVAGQRIYTPTNRYDRHTEFWELIAEREPVGVLGVPLTYPPKAVHGFLVSGAPDAEETDFAHPPSIQRELEARFDYRINSQYRRENGSELACEDEIDLIDMRFEAGKYLLSEYDVSFLQLTTFYINQFHHYLWDDDYTLEAWKVIDGHLDDLLDAGHNIVLMSDHGHNEIRTVFRVNQWLKRNGYLTVDQSIASTLHTLGINKDAIKRYLAQMDRAVPFEANLVNLGNKYVPRALLKHLPNQEGETGTRTEVPIVWDQTAAVASAQGPIYLTVDRDSGQYDTIREELKRKLEALTDQNGRPVVDTVHHSEDIYTGEYLDEAPDLLIDQAENVHIREHMGDKPVFSSKDPKWNGVNNRDGLFAATGPSFTSGTVEDISILDLAPTLLSLYRCPIPDDMDGQVRHAVLAEDVTVND